MTKKYWERTFFRALILAVPSTLLLSMLDAAGHRDVWLYDMVGLISLVSLASIILILIGVFLYLLPGLWRGE